VQFKGGHDRIDEVIAICAYAGDTQTESELRRSKYEMWCGSHGYMSSRLSGRYERGFF
jgi:hypothetical protein